MTSGNDAAYFELVRKVADELTKADSIWVFTHEEPDGDAYGSTLGLLLALLSIGKNARAFSHDAISRMYSKLPGIEKVEGPDVLPAAPPDVIIIVDNGDYERIGTPYASQVRERVSGGSLRKPLVINVDHHVSNTMYGDVNLVSPTSAAAGVIVYDIVTALGCEVSVGIAVDLYVALITDTGRFSFSNTNKRALDVAGELVERGVDPSRIIQDVYYTRTVNQMQLFARILSTLTAVPDLGALYAWQTREMISETGTKPSDTEGAVDLIRTIGEYPISIFFKENGEEAVKISMRSKNGFDVAAFAVLFGGGGHPAAAGFKVGAGLEDAIRIVLDRLRGSLGVAP